MPEQVIHKYILEPRAGLIDIFIPEGGEILSVQDQVNPLARMTFALWALVDPDAKPVQRRLEIAFTGHKLLPAKRKFLATVQKDRLVWHFFEIL